ncbi:hypothetical protein LTS18_014967 [Coniosporium uncinatum]|uniref:Uncharacterized protein n=1 Tax=Coniosporium uncinatum TaxID=93489 RepID=A0ACC3DZ20_9PEZI|nr:hypothetical protein LTS18_014967 [Coniosporium uncinatum]
MSEDGMTESTDGPAATSAQQMIDTLEAQVASYKLALDIQEAVTREVSFHNHRMETTVRDLKSQLQQERVRSSIVQSQMQHLEGKIVSLRELIQELKEERTEGKRTSGGVGLACSSDRSTAS